MFTTANAIYIFFVFVPFSCGKKLEDRVPIAVHTLFSTVGKVYVNALAKWVFHIPNLLLLMIAAYFSVKK